MINQQTGEKYYIIENEVVVTANNEFICQGGIACLKEYLTNLADKNVINTNIVNTTTVRTTVTYTVYVDTNGQEFWFTADGRVYNPLTKQLMQIIYMDEFKKNLVYKRVEKVDQTVTVTLVIVKGTNERY